MGSVTHVYEWFDGALRWRVPFDEVGQGAPVLCLPAPSTISTREEMRGLAERLARGRRVFLIDWPGFGEADRLPIRYRAPLFSRFLRAFVAQFAEPVDVVAAGHAAGYVLAVAPAAARRFGRLVFLAPTWRGPLPTAMGPHPRVWSALEALVRAPILGSLLYSANASRPFVRLMLRRHVFAEEAHLTGAL